MQSQGEYVGGFNGRQLKKGIIFISQFHRKEMLRKQDAMDLKDWHHNIPKDGAHILCGSSSTMGQTPTSNVILAFVVVSGRRVLLNNPFFVLFSPCGGFKCWCWAQVGLYPFSVGWWAIILLLFSATWAPWVVFHLLQGHRLTVFILLGELLLRLNFMKCRILLTLFVHVLIWSLVYLKLGSTVPFLKQYLFGKTLTGCYSVNNTIIRLY